MYDGYVHGSSTVHMRHFKLYDMSLHGYLSTSFFVMILDIIARQRTLRLIMSIPAFLYTYPFQNQNF